jgi:hypothetical protein
MKMLKTVTSIVLLFMLIVSLSSCNGALDKNIYIDAISVQRLDNTVNVYDIDISELNGSIFAIGRVLNPTVQGLLMSVDGTKEVRWVSQLPDTYGSYLINLSTSGGYCIGVGYIVYEEFIDMANNVRVSDAMIAEFDLAGNLIWIKKLDSDGDSSFFRFISQSSDGGYVAVGQVCDDYDAEKYHTIAVKYNKNGVEQWRRDYYDLNEDTNITSILSTNDGGFILAGGITDNDDPNGPSLALLYKIDENGEKEWIKTYEKEHAYPITCITKTTGGNYVAIESGIYGSSVMYITNYDEVGNIVWEKAYNLENEENYLLFNSITETEEGDFVAVGYMGGRRNSSGKRLPMQGFVTKINSKGKIKGKYQFKDGISREFTDIVQASDGSYYASGYTRIDAEEIYDQDKGIIVNFELP